MIYIFPICTLLTLFIDILPQTVWNYHYECINNIELVEIIFILNVKKFIFLKRIVEDIDGQIIGFLRDLVFIVCCPLVGYFFFFLPILKSKPKNSNIAFKTNEKYLQENLIADSGGIDDFFKYNRMSTYENNGIKSKTNIHNSSNLSLYSIADRISIPKHLVSKNIDHKFGEEDEKSFEVF